MVSEIKKILHFHKVGTGNKIVILFHGFGQTGLIFEEWFSDLSSNHTIYSFDLYYHGKSHRRDAHLVHEEWNTNFLRILQEENIRDYDLITFSLGGRFALSIVKFGLIKPNLLVMLAPDGFLQNFYYRLATYQVFNPLFKFLMNQPTKFDKVVYGISKLGLAPSGMIRFAKRELKEPESRISVYKTWTYFRTLQLSRKEIERLMDEKTRIHLILGSNDQIISAEELSSQYGHLKSLQIHLLQSKHNQLITDSKSLVASLLQDKNL